MTFAQTVMGVVMGCAIYDIIYTLFVGRNEDDDDGCYS